MTKLSCVGEFGLLELIRKRCRSSAPNIIGGIGEDCFLYKLPNKILSVTKDLLIEDIHFKRKWYQLYKIPFTQLGYKSLAVNISDLLAKGITSFKFCLIGLALPKDLKINIFKDFYKGLNALGEKFGLKVVGGDLSSGEKITISITLIGFSKKVILRSSAKINDYIVVTGPLGHSSAGLKILETLDKKKFRKFKSLVNSHLYPPIRHIDVSIINKYSLANSMIDCSDGLYPSIRFICEESGVGARIEIDRVPVSNEFLLYTGDNFPDYILYGGEDYELIFTIPEEKIKFLRKLPNACIIGEIMPKKYGLKFFLKGNIYETKKEGFQHFHNKLS